MTPTVLIVNPHLATAVRKMTLVFLSVLVISCGDNSSSETVVPPPATTPPTSDGGTGGDSPPDNSVSSDWDSANWDSFDWQ